MLGLEEGIVFLVVLSWLLWQRIWLCFLRLFLHILWLFLLCFVRCISSDVIFGQIVVLLLCHDHIQLVLQLLYVGCSLPQVV